MARVGAHWRPGRQTDEMAQWVKAIAAKPDKLSSIPGKHKVERPDSCKTSSVFNLSVLSHVYNDNTPPDTHTYTNKKKRFGEPPNARTYRFQGKDLYQSTHENQSGQ